MKQKLLSFIFVWTSLIGFAFAQNRQVSGRVTSAVDGTPVVGASVAVVGTSNASQTDASGNYVVTVQGNSVSLSVSYVGFVTQRVEVGAESIVNVQLQSEETALDEVVVTGYGTTTKLRQTGASISVSPKDIENNPFTSVDKAIQGKVAGLQSTGASGQPGSMQNIRIRGMGSISGSSEPLYVVDGIPINAGDLSRGTTTANALAGINPNDIADFTVLKDAAATAIYGSRGSNGVILITTKSGAAGKTKIKLDVEVGSVTPGTPTGKGRPLTTAENIELAWEAIANDGVTGQDAQDMYDAYFGFDETVNTNWYDEIRKNGMQHQYNLSFDGGDEKTQFHLGGGYFGQDGTIPTSDFRRISGNLNLKHKVDERFSIGTSMLASTSRTNGPLNSGFFSNPVMASFFLRPDLRAYNEDGTPNVSGPLAAGAGLYNPIAVLDLDRRTNNTQKFIGSFNAEYKILPNLTFTTKYGVDYNSIEEDNYNNPTYGDGRNINGAAARYYGRYFNWVWTNLLNYKWEIDDSGDWVSNIKAGYEAQKSTYYFSDLESNNLPANSTYRVPGVGATPITASGNIEDYAFASLLAIGDVSYQNKYVLSGSFRRDGSSRFGRSNQYGNFYSVGAAWNLDQEDFFQDFSWLSQLKLRTSYGVTGNAAIGNYASRTLYGYTRPTYNGASYNFVYEGVVGSGPVQYGVENLTWEKTKQFDVAVDFGFFNNRLGGSVEFYNKASSDLLLAVPVAYSSGYSSYFDNFGGMRNRGLEVTLNGTPVRNDNFTWNLSFNIGLNKNEVTSLVQDDLIDGNFFVRKVGENYLSYFVRQYAGADPEDGSPRWFVDESKTETTKTYNQAQRVLTGKTAMPKAFGGFNTSFLYKGIGLDASFYYNFGNYLYNPYYSYTNSGGWYLGSYNQLASELDRWQKPGDVTDVPRMSTENLNGYQASDRLLYKGDFIRLRDVTLSYALPNSILSKAKLSSVRIYARGANLWTWRGDDRLPFDPEASGSRDTQNTDYNGGTTNFDIFIPKTFTFGLNVGF